MRIGILTFHRAENFGAILQTFGLYTFLKREGHQVEVIDFRCKAIDVHYQIFNPEILWSRKNFIISFKEYKSRFSNIEIRKKRKAKFKKFINDNLKLSRKYNSICEPLDYEAIIVGSDQVWNFHLCKGSEKIFLLDFPFLKETKRISYAASSEKNGIEKIDKSIIANALKKFDRISVREDFLKDRLQELVEKEISVCLDPTFLLDKTDYESLVEKRFEHDYILVYQMTPFPEYMELIENLAKENGLSVIKIFGGYQNSKDTELSNTVRDWGPADVLSLIANARYVFTTSFHGLALSIIMEKDFWCIDKGDNFRQKNILTKLDLKNRLLDSPAGMRLDSIDYGDVREKLKKLVSQSKDFIKL